MKKIYRVTMPFSQDDLTHEYPLRFTFYATKKEAMKKANDALKYMKNGEWEIDTDYQMFSELRVDIIHFKNITMKRKLLLIANSELINIDVGNSFPWYEETLLTVDVMKYKGGE